MLNRPKNKAISVAISTLCIRAASLWTSHKNRDRHPWRASAVPSSRNSLLSARNKPTVRCTKYALPTLLGRCGSGPIRQLISADLVDSVATACAPQVAESVAGVAAWQFAAAPLLGRMTQVEHKIGTAGGR